MKRLPGLEERLLGQILSDPSVVCEVARHSEDGALVYERGLQELLGNRAGRIEHSNLLGTMRTNRTDGRAPKPTLVPGSCPAVSILFAQH